MPYYRPLRTPTWGVLVAAIVAALLLATLITSIRAGRQRAAVEAPPTGEAAVGAAAGRIPGTP
jgi:hypothetical protein